MGLDMNFSSSGMGNLVKNWDKCLNKYDDYVEKYLMYMRFFLCIFTLFWLNTFEEKNVLPYFPDNPHNTNLLVD